MWEYLSERVIEEANYLVESGCTVRSAAKKFGVSKSTVHNDVTIRLFSLDKELYKKVQKVLSVNLSERHIRGGNATKERYLKMKTE